MLISRATSSACYTNLSPSGPGGGWFMKQFNINQASSLTRRPTGHRYNTLKFDMRLKSKLYRWRGLITPSGPFPHLDFASWLMQRRDQHAPSLIRPNYVCMRRQAVCVIYWFSQRSECWFRSQPGQTSGKHTGRPGRTCNYICIRIIRTHSTQNYYKSVCRSKYMLGPTECLINQSITKQESADTFRFFYFTAPIAKPGGKDIVCYVTWRKMQTVQTVSDSKASHSYTNCIQSRAPTIFTWNLLIT